MDVWSFLKLPSILHLIENGQGVFRLKRVSLMHADTGLALNVTEKHRFFDVSGL
jgi:hypothetical protein